MASSGMKHNFSIIILLAVLFVACSGEEKLPNDILTQEEMTHIMIQIHLLEAKVGRLGISKDSALTVYAHFENVILKDSEVDSSIYFESFQYYSVHPKIFSKLYAAVTDSLMEMESKEKLKTDAIEEDKHLQDSLKKVKRRKIDSLNMNKLGIKNKPKGNQNKSKKDSTRNLRKLKLDAKSLE